MQQQMKQQTAKLAYSDSFEAAHEAANSKTCILGSLMQQGVKQQRIIWCCFTCCFIINPRLQVHAASLAAAYIIQDRKFLLFRQPALCDFEEVLAAAEHPRVQVAGDYFFGLTVLPVWYLSTWVTPLLSQLLNAYNHFKLHVSRRG